MNIPFKLAFNTTFQILGRVFTAISTAIITFLIAENFSISDYGSYTVVLSYISLFYVFSDFGLNAVFVREVGHDEERQRVYFKNLLGLRLVIAIATSFFAITILAFTDHPKLVKLGVIFALGILIAQTFSATALALFQAKIRYDQSLVADVFGAVANLLFVYLAVTNFSNIIFVIMALVAGSSVRAGVALYLARHQAQAFAFVFDVKLWRSLLVTALPIGLITIFSQINSQIDKQIVLLANYKPNFALTGEVAAGIYGFAYKLFELVITVPTYILNVGFPMMAKKKDEGGEKLLLFSKKLGAGLLVLSIIAGLIAIVIAPYIIEIIGAGKFEESVFTSRILFLGLPLFFVTPLTLWIGIILEKTKELLFIYGFTAFFNLVANLVFVPKFGYNAAAIITIVTEGIILVLSFTIIILNKSAFGVEK